VFIAWWSVVAALALFSVLLASLDLITAWRLLRENQRRCKQDQQRELDAKARSKDTDGH
jgi:hypothetical protein